MPAAPDMARAVLRRVPRSLCQQWHEHLCALVDMVSRRAIIFLFRYYGSVRARRKVSISHLRMTFCMLQEELLLQSFLSNIGSSRAVSSSVLGRKS